jgi:hypothetical protein
MNRIRPATLAVLVLVLAAAGFLVWSAVITPRMDSGVPEQGYRRPIQDEPATQKQEKKAPLVDSNVPPAAPPDK